jgi:hypothetical protein
MALSKIQAESMNLADTYAFSGTVSGASDVALISTQTTESASAIDFTGLDNTYNMYMVTFQNIQFASNDQTFVMRISDDNGSTFKSSNYLSVVDKSFYNGGTLGNEQLASVNYHYITPQVSNASDDRSCFGYIYFNTPATSKRQTFIGHTATKNVAAGGYVFDNKTSTVYNVNQTFNAIRFLGSANFAGTFKLYGYN